MTGVARLALAAVALGLVGCQAPGPPDVTIPIEGLDVAPRAVDAQELADIGGPRRATQLLRGTVGGVDLTVATAPGDAGACIWVKTGDDALASCGPLGGEVPGLPHGPNPIMVALSSPLHRDGPIVTAGIVDDTVASVVAELPEGRVARAVRVAGAPAGVAGELFVIVLPDSSRHELVARGEDGRVLRHIIFEGS